MQLQSQNDILQQQLAASARGSQHQMPQAAVSKASFLQQAQDGQFTPQLRQSEPAGTSSDREPAPSADLMNLVEARAEAAEHLAAKDSLAQQVLKLRSERAALQHVVHAVRQDLASSEQAKAELSIRVDSLQLQVRFLSKQWVLRWQSTTMGLAFHFTLNMSFPCAEHDIPECLIWHATLCLTVYYKV